jgi:hypothetical protein
MTRFTKKAALVILTVAVIAGCKKNDSGPSKTQLLTSGSWKLTSDYFDPAVDVNGDGHPVNEAITVLQPCFTDNLLIFNANGTAIRDEGATKCNPANPQIIETVNWKFLENETKIIVDEDTGELLELSASVLKIKIGDATQSVTLTFSH